MGYLSCNAESAIATCASDTWPRGGGVRTVKIREFTREELSAATNGFSAESFLGKGSHGRVYKAVLDGGKLTAAVKVSRHSSSSENEVEILSKVRHPRLVNLLGLCPAAEGPIAVVEFMPSGSLHEALHESPTRVPGWARRVRFGLQVAKAVAALHSADPPVIHRDIKSSNVLIDSRGRARLGDFGLALLMHLHRRARVPPAGTLGYLDPSYLAPADLTAKSDVFSFGVLLLELISGRNAIDVAYSPPSLLDWAAPFIRRRDFARICDARIGPPPDASLVAALASVAASCVRSAADKRPAMSDVVRSLSEIRSSVSTTAWRDLRCRGGSVAEPDVVTCRRGTAAVKMGIGKLVISLDGKVDADQTCDIVEKPLVSISDNNTAH